MARLVKTSVSSEIFCDIVTTFEDESMEVRQIKAGDILEDPGLRYVYNGAVRTVNGRVTSISTNMVSKLAKIDLKNPVDNFTKDCYVTNIGMDCSEQYVSKLIQVPAKEVVENEGVVDVSSVHCYPHPKVTMIMEYTDGSVANQELEVGDVLEYVKIMTQPGKPDIEGSFKVMCFSYTKNGNRPRFDGVVLKSTTKPGDAINVAFNKILSFEEIPAVDVTVSNSLSSIAAALATAPNGKVAAALDVDVTIPPRADGKITTLMINQGCELDFDLNGHDLNTQAYAFYVNGGTLNIYNSGNGGKINVGMPDKTYPAIQVMSGGVCNMEGGIIDTTNVELEEGQCNWMYGVVCSGDGIFNMHSGQLITAAASGIAITNGTASGEGAQFIIAGDSVITTTDCGAVYLADNKKLVVKDKAIINSGVVARMGDITVQDNAVVNSITDINKACNYGELATFSGVDTPKSAILALTGVYNSSLGNDMNIVIKDNAKVNGIVDTAIDICEINTKYDQKVTIDIASNKNITAASGKSIYRIYSNEELAVMAEEAGKHLGPETNTTDLTITISGEQVIPVPVNEDTVEPEAPSDENQGE